MIPLSVPYLNGNEWKYVKDCLDTGWVSSAGAYVSKFEKAVADFSSMPNGVAVVNGTSGLHLALHCLGVGSDDYVIVPNITFIASANSIAYTNAEPIFIDVDFETWQMDLDLLVQFLQENTENNGSFTRLKSDGKTIKAIMPVHVLGNMCDMEKLMKIAQQYNIFVVEDATESLGSSCHDKPSGSFGDASVFSFNGNKIITTGGGGVIVSRNEDIIRRAKHLSTQSKVNPETYYHDEIGFNYRLVNVLAAIGVAQMEQLPHFIKKKKDIDKYYKQELSNIGDIVFQKIESYVDSNCWLFTFSSEKQQDILTALKENNIVARPFWTPMDQLPMFTGLKYYHKNDVSRNIHKKCLSIPCSVNITKEEMDKVISTIKSVF